MMRAPRLSTCMRYAADRGDNKNEKGSLLLPMQDSVCGLHRVSGVSHVLKGLQCKQTEKHRKCTYCIPLTAAQPANISNKRRWSFNENAPQKQTLEGSSPPKYC